MKEDEVSCDKVPNLLRIANEPQPIVLRVSQLDSFSHGGPNRNFVRCYIKIFYGGDGTRNILSHFFTTIFVLYHFLLQSIKCSYEQSVTPISEVPIPLTLIICKRLFRKNETDE